MVEKRYTYTTKIKQPQSVGAIKLDPKGGVISERNYRTLKKDAYGASLLEKGLLVVEETKSEEPDADADQEGKSSGETIPDFDSINEGIDASGKGYENGKDRPESHAGWRPE
jgi:hypothetical protein